MRTLITGIRQLAGVDCEFKERLQGAEMSRFASLEDAWLLVENGRIADFGRTSELDAQIPVD